MQIKATQALPHALVYKDIDIHIFTWYWYVIFNRLALWLGKDKWDEW